MVTKNITISEKDANFLEEAIVRYGRIVSFDDLQKIFKKEYTAKEIRYRISRLIRKGWLLSLKKGLYVIITDIGALGTSDISLNTICQALNKDSYISFENALQYHGMFDQMLSTAGAVTYQRARKYQVQNAEVKFFKIQKKLYFGFSQERSDIGLINMASKEKALLDILYFRSNVYYANLVFEKLTENRHMIDFDLLKTYARKFNLDVIRQIGFFLDRNDVDTQDLVQMVQGKNNYSRMTKDAKQFDAKWRLYFDPAVVK
jgi:predicted transcriptional regulator of viral defense system